MKTIQFGISVLVVGAISSVGSAQLDNGDLIALAWSPSNPSSGGIRVVDSHDGTVQDLMITGLPARAGGRPGCIMVETQSSFLLAESADLFRVGVVDGSWTAARLTSLPFGEFTDIAITSNGIFGLAAETAGWNTWVWEIPLSGGLPTIATTIVGSPSSNPASASRMTTVSDTLHVVTYADGVGGAAPGHWTLDTTRQPYTAEFVSDLPDSQRPGAFGYRFGPIGIEFDPDANILVFAGTYGDVLIRNLFGDNVLHRYVDSPLASTLPSGDRWGSCAFDLRSGHIWLGDLGGFVEDLQCPDGEFRLDRFQVDADPSVSIASLAVVPGGGSFRTYGGGCAQSSGRPACSGLRGAPTIGSSDFAMTVQTPSSMAVLLVGASSSSVGSMPLPLDLGSLGAIGCQLRTSAEASIQGSPIPGGFESPFTPPSGLVLPLFAQWAVSDAINPLGVVMSDARELR